MPPHVLRKIALRLVPFLCLLYFFNILDRNNVAFAYAKTSMPDDVGVGPRLFELGIGIFYLGYLAFEVPANLLMRRFGARRWMARIMISWGVVSCATAAVDGPVGFYTVRTLLGVAEAGFFPGIILYLTYWFPASSRSRVTAYFMLAIALSGLFGSPLSGAIVQAFGGAEGGFAGLRSWRWLFLLEGVPSILLGVAVLFVLPDGPDDAPWLTPDERDAVKAHLAREEAEKPPHRAGLAGALLDGRVWLLIALYTTVAVGANAAGAHFPKLIAQTYPDADALRVGVLGGLPSLCALLAMPALAWSSDRRGERRGHVAFASAAAAGGWALAALAPSPWLTLAGMCLAMAGMMAFLVTFWAIPPSLLGGTAAAGGIALINSVANVGGLFAPPILGGSLDHGERVVTWLGVGPMPRFGLLAMAATMALGAALALAVPRTPAARAPLASAVERR